MGKIRGFTLIELLIVVAIIAILALIAVPNFLEAQVRSKVSRQKANMRTVATAFESYAVDQNHYPPVTDNPVNGSWLPEERWKVYPGCMTTPIAYVSSDEPLMDIFRFPHNFPSKLAWQIYYLPTFWYSDDYSGSASIYPAQYNYYGAWVIRSAGPDLYYQNHPGENFDYGAGPSGWNRASYDATNGSTSAGDIYRSQNDADKINPRAP